MKKVLALVLIAALMTPMTVSVFATNDDPATVVFNDEFNFRYVDYDVRNAEIQDSIQYKPD